MFDEFLTICEQFLLLEEEIVMDYDIGLETKFFVIEQQSDIIKFYFH
jgi:hypothetical protein